MFGYRNSYTDDIIIKVQSTIDSMKKHADNFLAECVMGFRPLRRNELHWSLHDQFKRELAQFFQGINSTPERLARVNQMIAQTIDTEPKQIQSKLVVKAVNKAIGVVLKEQLALSTGIDSAANRQVTKQSFLNMLLKYTLFNLEALNERVFHDIEMDVEFLKKALLLDNDPNDKESENMLVVRLNHCLKYPNALRYVFDHVLQNNPQAQLLDQLRHSVRCLMRIPVNLIEDKPVSEISFSDYFYINYEVTNLTMDNCLGYLKALHVSLTNKVATTTEHATLIGQYKEALLVKDDNEFLEAVNYIKDNAALFVERFKQINQAHSDLDYGDLLHLSYKTLKNGLNESQAQDFVTSFIGTEITLEQPKLREGDLDTLKNSKEPIIR